MPTRTRTPSQMQLATKEIVLLLLYVPGPEGVVAEPIRGRTRLMKMLFLFGKEVRTQFAADRPQVGVKLPDFQPYDFGPYSQQIYVDLEFLLDLGFVQTVRQSGSEPVLEQVAETAYWRSSLGADDTLEDPYSEEEFALTSEGSEFVQTRLLEQVTQNQLEILRLFKVRCLEVPLKQLLKYVYSKYPEMTTQSKIREQVLGG